MKSEQNQPPQTPPEENAQTEKPMISNTADDDFSEQTLSQSDEDDTAAKDEQSSDDADAPNSELENDAPVDENEALAPDLEDENSVEDRISFEEMLTPFQEKTAWLEQQGGESDFQAFAAAHEAFSKWRDALIRLGENFDDLCFDFTGTLEDSTFGIVRDRALLNIAVKPRDLAHNLEAIEMLYRESRELDEQAAPDDLLKLSGANLRKAGDLDFRLQDSLLPDDLRVLQKNAVNTLLLIFKQLTKSSEKMFSLLAWTAARETFWLNPPERLDSGRALHIVFNDALSDSEKQENLTALLDEAEALLQKNYKKANDAAQTAKRIREKYFALLRKTLITVVNGVYSARMFYLEQIERTERVEGREQLKNWSGIYDGLLGLLEKFLAEKLGIFRIACERGREFDPDRHKPFLESEPDDELDENRIKSVVNLGFWFQDGENEAVVKEVDVIVVSKKERK